jgi:hypothetical protein
LAIIRFVRSIACCKSLSVNFLYGSYFSTF